MSDSVLLSYRFSSPHPDSRDSSHVLEGQPGAIVAGPGDTALGPLATAMRFGGNEWLRTPLGAADVPGRAFTLRMLVQPAALAATELLCRCETVPFSLSLVAGPAGDAGRRGVQALVDAAAHGTQGIGSAHAGVTVPAGAWVLLEIAYHFDTLAMFVNGRIVHAFGLADGRLRTAPAGRLLVGGDEADAGTRFHGLIAALDVLDGVPDALSRAVDAARLSPQWHITHHFTLRDGASRVGRAVGSFEPGVGAGTTQIRFERGLLMHGARLGAFLLDGDLCRGYLALGGEAKKALGALTSDAFTVRGCIRARFAGGGMFCTDTIRPIPVIGPIFLHYMKLGGPEGVAGPPRNARQKIAGGWEQAFIRARYYLHVQSGRVNEVRDRILQKFLSLGATVGCGFPLTDQEPLMRGDEEAGARADFEKCSIFQDAAGRCFAVPPDFLAVHAANGGVQGELGMPTADVVQVRMDGRFAECQTFEGGSIVRVPGFTDPFVCLRFDLYLGDLDTIGSDGIFGGQNDPYMHVGVYAGRPGEPEVVVGQVRCPPSGTYPGNQANVDTRMDLGLETTDPYAVYRLRAMVWDADGLLGGSDDLLGDLGYELSVFNAWGQADGEGVIELHDDRATLRFSVQPRFSQQDYTFEEWRFFGIGT